MASKDWLIEGRYVRLGGDLVDEPRRQPRLADAGFARDEHDLPAALARQPPPVEEVLALLLAADEACQTTGSRLEAALERAHALDREGLHQRACKLLDRQMRLRLRRAIVACLQQPVRAAHTYLKFSR